MARLEACEGMAQRFFESLHPGLEIAADFKSRVPGTERLRLVVNHFDQDDRFTSCGLSCPQLFCTSSSSFSCLVFTQGE